jgi:hypothetical protein
MTNPAGYDPVPLDDYEPLLLATKEHFDKYWTYTKPLLEKCVKRSMHGEMTADDIYNLALQGKVYIFVVKCDKGLMPSVKLALALEIVVYPRLSAMNILALGGEHLQEFYSMYWKRLCGWAFMNGVRAIEGYVSPAMERIISRYGFKNTYAHMRLDLTEV